MELEGLSKRQQMLAELLWSCKGRDEVDVIIKAFGKDAEVIMHMILAGCIDEATESDTEFALAKSIIEDIKG